MKNSWSYTYACLHRNSLSLTDRKFVLYCIRVPAANAPRMHCSRRLIVQTLVFSHSYLHRQVSPPETLVVKGETTWARNGRWILPESSRLPRNIQGSFTCRKSTTWDKPLYFPSEGRRAEDFFALKNLTASVGFEPANLGKCVTLLSVSETLSRSRQKCCMLC